jgi:hypothetical protein
MIRTAIYLSVLILALYSASFSQGTGEVVTRFAISTGPVPNTTSWRMFWTAPGDDDSVGVASVYDLRYYSSRITEANWALATPVAGEPVPQPFGTIQYCDVPGLTWGNTYWFALKTQDDAGNWSAISNASVKIMPARPAEDSVVTYVSLMPRGSTTFPQDTTLVSNRYIVNPASTAYSSPKTGVLVARIPEYTPQWVKTRDIQHIVLLPEFRYNLQYQDAVVNGLDFQSLFQYLFLK